MRLPRRLVLPIVAALAAFTGTATAQTGPPQTDPNGIINLPAGYSYSVIAEACLDPVQSTESGATFPMPDDFDANVLFQAPGNVTWLLSNHELTQPRSGDFQGDAGKCHVDEQTPGDDDSDGWGSVSRLVLAKDGTTVVRRDLITTGLHNLCAGAQTPWKTFLTNEEFPFIADPGLTSGWVWEIDPATGAQTRATGMGRFSHEQEARAANGTWYLTDDRGNYQYLYKFVPDSQRDLVNGELFGLVFDRATNTGTWVGPLDPFAPEADMIARVGPPGPTNSFSKAEGIVAADTGDSVVFSESASGPDPGRVFQLTDLTHRVITGHTLVEGDFARMSRPDNLRYNDAGDLFIMEDNGSALGNPLTGGVNQIWVLPRHQEGAANLIHFATLPDGEPTGPWFSFDNELLYLSIQDQTIPTSTATSRIIAIRHPGNFNQPYDR